MLCSDAQSYPTLCDSMDCSPPGSSVHGILLVGILEWGRISSSSEFFWPRDQAIVSYTCLLHWQTDLFFFTTSTTREAHLLTGSFQINSKQLYAITSSISLPQLILLFFSNELPLTYPPAYKSTLGIFFLSSFFCISPISKIVIVFLLIYHSQWYCLNSINCWA